MNSDEAAGSSGVASDASTSTTASSSGEATTSPDPGESTTAAASDEDGEFGDECINTEDCPEEKTCYWGYCEPVDAEPCASLPNLIAIPLPDGVEGATVLAFMRLQGGPSEALVVGTANGAQHVDSNGPQPIPLPPGAAPQDIAVADLDGDDDDDLVMAVTGPGGDSLETFLQDGAGQLISTQSLPGIYHGLSTGDLTGDGLPEVAATSPGGAPYIVTVLVNADGALASSVVMATNASAQMTAIGNLDGDGFADLGAHVADVLDYTAWWAGSAMLDAAPEAIQPTPEGPLAMGAGSVGGSAGYFDALVTVNAYSWTRVEEWQGADGGPYFGNVSGVPMAAWSADIGDIDADGEAEVVLGGAGTVGALTYTCQWVVAAPHDVAHIAVGDYDGDGASDIAISDGMTTSMLRVES